MQHRWFAQGLVIVSLTGCGASGDEPQNGLAETAQTEVPQAGPTQVEASEEVPSQTGLEEEIVPEIASGMLTCTAPVSGGDTARSLLTRFGEAAEIGLLPGGEGTTVPGVILWSADTARRIEIGFESEARERVTFLRVAQGSDWKVADIGLGDSLQRVVKFNEGPIDFYGFEWDYAGTVAEFRGGKLDQLDGGCKPLMTLTYDLNGAALPEGLIGDRLVPSTSSDITDGLTVIELGLDFAR